MSKSGEVGEGPTDSVAAELGGAEPLALRSLEGEAPADGLKVSLGPPPLGVAAPEGLCGTEAVREPSAVPLAAGEAEVAEADAAGHAEARGEGLIEADADVHPDAPRVKVGTNENAAVALCRCKSDAAVVLVTVGDCGAEADAVGEPGALTSPVVLAERENDALLDFMEAEALLLALSDKDASVAEAEGEAAAEAVNWADREGSSGVALTLGVELPDTDGKSERVASAVAEAENAKEAEGAEFEYRGVPLGLGCRLADAPGVCVGANVGAKELEAGAVGVGAVAEGHGQGERHADGKPACVFLGLWDAQPICARQRHSHSYSKRGARHCLGESVPGPALPHRAPLSVCEWLLHGPGHGKPRWHGLLDRHGCAVQQLDGELMRHGCSVGGAIGLGGAAHCHGGARDPELERKRNRIAQPPSHAHLFYLRIPVHCNKQNGLPHRFLASLCHCFPHQGHSHPVRNSVRKQHRLPRQGHPLRERHPLGVPQLIRLAHGPRLAIAISLQSRHRLKHGLPHHHPICSSI